MSLLDDLAQAWRGWAETVAGTPGAAKNFAATRRGLLAALFWFAISVLLSTAVDAAMVGMPSLVQVLLGVVAQAITIAALAYVMRGSLRFLKLDTPVLALFVPVLYAMAFMFVLAIPLNFIGPSAALIAFLLLALLIFRAGMTIARMSAGVALAFALICFMVLVAVPYALYMVILRVPSPA